MPTSNFDWFATASLAEIAQYSIALEEDHTAELILFNTFLNPDPAVFQLWSTQHLKSISFQHMQLRHWAYTLLKASPAHRAHFITMMGNLNPAVQKEMLYEAICMRDHALMDNLLKIVPTVSPAHLIRHAVVNKNKKGALSLMKQYPKDILEAQSMILHESYKKIHPYWGRIYAAHQKRTLTQEIQTDIHTKTAKISKI